MAPNWSQTIEILPYTISPVLVRSCGKRVWESGNWEDARPGHYRTIQNGRVVTDCIGAKTRIAHFAFGQQPKKERWTTRDSYQILHKDWCIHLLGDGTKLLTLDARWEYWQVKIPELDHANTAFTFHWGQFCFTRKPFGLQTSWRRFSARWTSCSLRKVGVSFGLFKRLYNILTSGTLAHRACLTGTITLKRLKVLTNRFHFLGHVIHKVSLEVLTRMIDEVCRFKLPINLTEPQSFVDLCSFFRRFLLYFAQVATMPEVKPRKIRQQTFYGLSVEEFTAFQTLKVKLIEPSVLELPCGKATIL